MKRVPLVFVAVAAVAGCGGGTGADGSLSVETVVLEGPPGGEAVYEPHVAVTEDGRVLVAAQYGVGYNRGGLRFWTGLRGGPGGAAWQEEEAVPRPLTADPTMAADATVAIGPDGTRYLLGLSAESTRVGVPDAALVLATAPPGGGPFTHRLTLAQVEEPSPGVLTATDKPWMALDPDTSEGPTGTLYLGWTALTVHLDRDPIEIERTLMVATSRDGGTVEPAVAVADEGMGVQLAVRPDGTLDAVWTELRDQGDRPATRMLHASSRDRGRAFSEAAVLVELDEGGGDGLGHAALAAAEDGTLMACWPQGPESTEGWTVWCSRFREGGGWGPPTEVDAGPDALAVSFPAVAAAGGSWWLSAYVATRDTVAVTLFRSDGEARSWRRIQSLVAAPVSFGRYCPAPGLPCRSDETTVFPGDYVSAAGRGSVMGVAWVLPGGGVDGADAAGRLGVSVVGLGR